MVTNMSFHSDEQMRSDTIDLGDNSLLVDISDALSERDKVKFTVHTKVCCMIKGLFID